MKLKPIKEKLSPAQRLYQQEVPIIGLTGGIGSGKSTVATKLKERGHPLICADELVKQVYEHPNTLEFIDQLCPEVLLDQKQIDFSKLRRLAFSAPNILSQIENFIYQRLPSAFEKGLQELNRPSYLIYDVPLLFEKDLASQVDQVVSVYCTRKTQKQRAMQRDHSDEKTIESILDKQVSIENKKDMSNWVINNTADFAHLETEVDKFEKEYFTQAGQTPWPAPIR